MTGATIFEDMTFTVTSEGLAGIRVAYYGRDGDGNGLYQGNLADRVEEACRVEHHLDRHLIPKALAKVVGIERAWQTLNRSGTAWVRDGEDFMIRVDRSEGADGVPEYWLRTQDDEGLPTGPRETPEVFDLKGAREEAARLVAEAGHSPRP